MKRMVFCLMAMMVVLSLSAQSSIYDFTVKDDAGKDVSLAKYKGKVLLIVNTATRCGFTPQYKDLEPLYQKYHDQGFEILDFPCNQFGQQAPGTCCLGGPVRFLLSNEKCKFFLDRLDIPADYKLNYILAIGYPDEQPDAKPRDASKVKYIK